MKTRLIRLAIYAVSTKQGRQVIYGIIAGIMCIFFIPMLIVSGAASSYLTVFGGEYNDVYNEAIKSVQQDYEIENSFDPVILRSLQYLKTNSTEATQAEIENELTDYFIRSVELPRTVTLEDIEALKEEIRQVQNEIADVSADLNINNLTITELKNELDLLEREISNTKALIDSWKNFQHLNQLLINRLTKKLNSLLTQKSAISSEIDRLIISQNELEEQKESAEEKKKQLDDKLRAAEKTYAEEPLTKYFFLTFEEAKSVLTAAPFSLDSDTIKDIEDCINMVNTYCYVDISNITFENENANDVQKKVVKVACSAADYGIKAKYGKCQAWVADIYLKATGSRGNAPSAIDAGQRWSVSNNWSTIQIGATVYGYSSNPYGHTGIYIGNGLVIHNLDGTVITQTLDSWVKSYKGVCWGWENGQNLSGDPQFDIVGGLI